MNLTLKVETSGALLAGKGPEIVQKGLDRAITEATMLLWAEVKKRTPQGVFGAQGGLLESIKTDFPGKGTPVSKGIVATQQKYAEVIEKGRQPGKGVSKEGKEALARWIQVKLGITGEKELKQVTFLISRKIKTKGFEGHHMFEQALHDNLSRVEGIFAKHGMTIAQELQA